DVKAGGYEYADLETGRTTQPKGVGRYGAGFIRAGDVYVYPDVIWTQNRKLVFVEYDLKTGELLGEYRVAPDDRVRVAPPVKQGRELVYAIPFANKIRVWDLVERKQLREFTLNGGRKPDTYPFHLMWSDFRVSQPDGKWIVVTRSDGMPEV